MYILRTYVQYIQGADVEAKGQDGFRALHIATLGAHEALVQLLLEKGASIKAKDGCGRTALRITKGEGHKAIVRLLEFHKSRTRW